MNSFNVPDWAYPRFVYKGLDWKIERIRWENDDGSITDYGWMISVDTSSCQYSSLVDTRSEIPDEVDSLLKLMREDGIIE